MCILISPVGDPPKITSGVTDVTIIAPEVATMECDVRPGTKDVELHWYKDSHECYPGRKYEILFYNNQASLVIKNTEISDTAKYTCEVANPLGIVESSGYLTVYSKLSLNLLPYVTSYILVNCLYYNCAAIR